jgi:O-antigen polysaccharide polymerase Wzy-like protein
VRLRSLSFQRALLAYGVSAGVLALTIALFASAAATDPVIRFWWIAACSIAALGSLVALAGTWSAIAVYAAVFWCFHFGLIGSLATGYISPSDLPLGDESWVVGAFSGDAAILALAGLLAFAAGASFVYSRREFRRGDSREPEHRAATAHPYGPMGAVLVFGSIASWCLVVLATGGVSGFFVSYEDFLQMTSAFSLPLAIISRALACGVVLTVSGGPGWHRTSAMVAYAAFAVVALPIGLRTEVMFPAVAAVVALARCGRTFSSIKAGALAAALLLLIPLIREVRTTGVSALPQALVAPRLDALVEMGESLHPVEQVIRWHAEGEPYEYGSSYWAPFERAAARLLPGVDPMAAEDDLRLMNVLVLDRIGAIGFSPVAEAYRNFGPAGVVVVLALFGAAMAGIDTIRDRQTAVLAIATVYPPLLINIRNSFVSVPAQCAAGILVVFAAAGVRHIAGSVLPKSNARAPYLRSEI